MARATSVTTDLTTCPICRDIFDNPKSLPCLHAFCLACLQEYCKDKYPGDEESCPVCRKEFEIPDDGVDGLQHHFFIQRLVDSRKAESGAGFNEDEVLCEICLEENDEGSSKILPATLCCVDCNRKLCYQCSKAHRRMEGGAHRIKPLDAEAEQELLQLRGLACDKHKDKKVELYCHDCNANVCLACSAASHRNHNGVEIPEAANYFRLRIGDDDKKILHSINSVRRQSRQTKLDVAKFLSKIENMKKMVLVSGDEVKHLVDDRVSDVLMEMQSLVSDSDKEAESLEQRYQLALVSMESFHAYSRELLDKGRPSDITRAARGLHDRANELLDSVVTAAKYCPPHVTFTPADVTQVYRLNLIGKVTIMTENQPGSLHNV